MDIFNFQDLTGEFSVLDAERRCGPQPLCQRGWYRAHVEWPGERIEPFQIGRLLWKINWVARHEPQWLFPTVERHVPVFEHYEQTGRVICPVESVMP